MRLVFAGTPEPAVVALQKLIDSEHEVVAVLTRPDARRGRGRSLHASPVKALAREQGIEVLTPETLRDNEAIRARLTQLAPDAIPVVAYGNLIPQDMLDIAPHGWVNLHFSKLPAWRGAAPVQAAIRNGDEKTGVTVFRINEGLDTGDILAIKEEEIRRSDTADDLLTRLAYRGADLLVETMTALDNGTAVATPQPEKGTYAPKLATADARVDWAKPAKEVDRLIRAYTPGPGAWTTWQDARIKVGPVTTTDTKQLQPGHVQVGRSSVVVGTGSFDVVLGLIQPPGKKMMEANAWVRGLAADVVDEGVVFE
ncbi:methionyl-tRNA formyltransferase [Corynebacterium mayonis]|uniref:methionyl-tRNA formyltransferase n=1 Tax=Corynebacterium mayonis TaxID=3062461 RepID=UPI00314039E4